MGILDFFMGIQDPIEGQYRITSATRPPVDSSVASCDMVGELSAAGIGPRTIEHNSPFTSVGKWPRVGDVLPVLVDRDNPEFLRIEWKEVPERGE